MDLDEFEKFFVEMPSGFRFEDEIVVGIHVDSTPPPSVSFPVKYFKMLLAGRVR